MSATLTAASKALLTAEMGARFQAAIDDTYAYDDIPEDVFVAHLRAIEAAAAASAADEVAALRGALIGLREGSPEDLCWCPGGPDGGTHDHYCVQAQQALGPLARTSPGVREADAWTCGWCRHTRVWHDDTDACKVEHCHPMPVAAPETPTANVALSSTQVALAPQTPAAGCADCGHEKWVHGAWCTGDGTEFGRCPCPAFQPPRVG